MGIIRLLLALAVVVSHGSSALQKTTLFGSLAVQGFYVISGFYMALILNRKYTFKGGTKLFYQQRYLRLAPMYWLAVLITIGVCAFYTLLTHKAAGKFEAWMEYGGHFTPGSLAVISLSQLTMFGLDGIMFLGFSGNPLSLHFTANWAVENLPAVKFLLVPPAWSLSVELLFYVIAPFIVRRSAKFQLGLVALAFALRIFAVSVLGLSNDPWNNRFFPFETGIFLLGSLGYKCLPAAEKVMRSRGIFRWIITLFLGGIIVFYRAIPLPEEVRHWIFIALVAASVPLLFAATQHDALDRWIGELSYPLYLLHQAAFFAAEPVFRRLHGFGFEVARLVIPLALTIVCCLLFERPLEAWRARFFNRRKAALSPVGMRAHIRPLR